MLNNKRLHWTTASEIELWHRYPSRVAPKPHGLWYSVGLEWHDWCQSSEWAPTHRMNLFEFELDLDSILCLTTINELQEFTSRFKTDLYINWMGPRLEYKGIEVAPYLADAAFSDFNSWYYGWDVASGCIWDLSAIKSVHRIHEWPSILKSEYQDA